MTPQQEEYMRIRGLDDDEIVEECGKHEDAIVRELANRYDVLCQKHDSGFSPDPESPNDWG